MKKKTVLDQDLIQLWPLSVEVLLFHFISIVIFFLS